MKIITWNVNGLRAVLGKGVWDWVDRQQADVVCLQEVKMQPSQLAPEQAAQFEACEMHWNSGSRPGYSGVLTLLREPCEEVTIGMGNWFEDLEGRVVQTRHAGFTLFNVYFPNGQRDYGRLSFKLDFYKRLLDCCDEMHARGEKIIICGDFNTAHQEIDLKNPKQNAMTSGFLPEERAWIDRFLAHGFVDAYRSLYPQRVGYTWWTYRMGARAKNIGWRLDYFLVSVGLMPKVRDVTIHPEILGSDHCPVSLEIEL